MIYACDLDLDEYVCMPLFLDESSGSQCFVSIGVIRAMCLARGGEGVAIVASICHTRNGLQTVGICSVFRSTKKIINETGRPLVTSHCLRNRHEQLVSGRLGRG